MKLGVPKPQQGQHFGQSGVTNLLLIYILTSNLNPHLIRLIQKKPNVKIECFKVRGWISFLKPNLYFLYFSALKEYKSLKKSFSQ